VSASDLPTAVRAVVVGGGIAGTSVAYHLAALGWRDVLLLEQNELSAGTTWHAAGAVGRLRVTGSLARMNDRSAKLYERLEAETGVPTGYKQVGGLALAQREERMTQLRRTGAMAEHFGVEVHIISPAEAAEIWPLANLSDIIGAAWLPHDGRAEPAQLPRAIGEGARQHGATICEGVRVLSLLQENGRVTGVRTDRGDVAAETVVLACGMWTRQLALDCGVSVPLHPVEHHYLLSNSTGQDLDNAPVTRDLDGTIYFRGDGDGILIGAFQPQSKPWLVDRVPDDFAFSLLEPDWEHFEEPLAEGYARLPILREIGFRQFVNGPESFTPDGNLIMGETPEVAGLYVLAGFNSSGLAFGGGAGEALAQWIVGGAQPFDLWTVDIRRFGPWQNNRAFLRARTVETLGLHFRLAAPNLEPEHGRDLRRSPLHDRLAAHGAWFGQKMGSERPYWFAGPGQRPSVVYGFGRQNWFENHRREHMAAREAVAVFDQSSFGKFTLAGPDACALLQRLCGNDVDVEIGRVVYTGMFNERGAFESDLTIIRVASEEFLAITGTAQVIRDQAWIRRQIGPGEKVVLVDVTSANGVLGVMGPHARALLQPLTDSDLSDGAFPFGTSRTIGIGHATCRALRLTYVGELGWELHVPADQATLLYDAIWQAGPTQGLVNAGHYAINSLRLEKGYRAWGADITTDDTPLEAGLGFAVAWDKAAAFLGRDALLAQRATGIGHKRMVSIVLDDPEPVLWGGERFFRDGVTAGFTTSGAYGHAIGAAVGLGYVHAGEPVTPEFLAAAHWEVDVAGSLVPARVAFAPPYDPQRTRILA
jgi:glycine cleavage system aminomethyltransferase T/glycine/D-amino acid oxidase-like deaminating enzyme